MERLPSIVSGFEPKDIWNCDETGLFWKALPDKGLAEKKKACKGGKKSKLRVTVLFFVNGEGVSKCPPSVIWKSENPRCFKRIKKADLPVWYYSQKKSWMDGELLHTILGKINNKLIAHHNNRKILLLLDNAGCHPSNIVEKYSNIKVVFLPPNTTSELQPLDLGIIQTFKTYYRKLFMHYIITKIDECSSATEVSSSITILQAIHWIAEAWKNVDSMVINKCFRKSGILDRDFHVIEECAAFNEDPFADLDVEEEADETEMQDLIHKTCGSMNSSFEDGVNGVPTCFDVNDEKWQEKFFEELDPTKSPKHPHNADDDSEDDSGDKIETENKTYLPPCVINTYKEAVSCIEDVRAFLQSKGHATEANQMMEISSKISQLHCQQILSLHCTQTFISDFFHN